MPRESAGGRFTPRQPAAAEPSPSMASPEAARNTMSALQRGWQLGRVEAEQDATSASGSYSERGVRTARVPHDTDHIHDRSGTRSVRRRYLQLGA